MITDFNEKGHPMVFSEEPVNTEHLKEKCRAAMASLTRQHGLAERLSEACFMIALSETENNWQKRAEAAEAKLAEMEKQPPIEYRVVDSDGDVTARRDTLEEAQETVSRWNKGWSIQPLFTRPAPAVSLAELVPEQSLNGQAQFLGDKEPYYNRGWNDCRAAILRKIEEAK